jgi:ABC-type nitrate/sulfonate/bicarbonate transport system ATPase subunit
MKHLLTNTYPKNNNKKLEVIHFKENYENILIVDDISLELRENEFVSLIGPSGCGKTTIFNMISGLVHIDSGKVIIDGKECTGETGRASYMYQKDLLLPWQKIVDNIALPLRIRGYNKKDSYQRVKKYFKLFGLDGFEYKYPHQLSGGMRQRAALLRTYMCSNDIILLDEPFGGLDAITRFKMQNWLLEVLEKLQVSILFVTHDIEEAVFLSDRIYVLSNRPAKIKKEIIVNLSKPRQRDIVTSQEFNEIEKDILSLL